MTPYPEPIRLLLDRECTLAQAELDAAQQRCDECAQMHETAVRTLAMRRARLAALLACKQMTPYVGSGC